MCVELNTFDVALKIILKILLLFCIYIFISDFDQMMRKFGMNNLQCTYFVLY
uniref:Uncharacterized protein n=1 Tax=Wuchereria bancrofti TaxID=6293 RepID=A0AAF5PM17_WUCBA